jgi:hypothetical protein
MRKRKITHCKVLEGARVLDVKKRSLEVLQLNVDFRLCLLRLCNLEQPAFRKKTVIK